jgi:hypothetical protein
MPSVFLPRRYHYTAACVHNFISPLFLPRHYQWTTLYFFSIYCAPCVPSQALPVQCSLLLFSIHWPPCVLSQALSLHCSPLVFSIHWAFCVPSQALPVYCSRFVFSIHCGLCVPLQALPLHCSLCSVFTVHLCILCLLIKWIYADFNKQSKYAINAKH